MVMRISALQPSGEVMVLDVSPEMMVHELKQQIKEAQPWDSITCKTTRVEIIAGDDQLLDDDAKVLDTGLAADAGLASVVFKVNMVVCSNKDDIASLESDIDPELLLVVEIPNHEMQVIERAAFQQCHVLAKLNIPDSVTHIGDFSFEGCVCLESLTIPDSVTGIGIGAFRNCNSLASLTLSNSVTHIGNFAFQNCSSLVQLRDPL